MTTLNAMNLPFEEAIAYLRQKTNTTSEHWTDVFGRANTKSFTVAGATTRDLVGDFRTEVAKAIEKGTSLQEFGKSFDDIVSRHGWEHTGTPGWRARIIFETNLGMAYSAGRYQQMTEPETLAAFPYWQYVHSGSLHPRPHHKAWDGTLLRADDPWWDSHYPPNGWRCGCRVRPVSARGMARMGRTGPDSAPVIDTRQWVNPHTGEVLHVPVGIDPGFGYNPGREWKAERVQLPGNATLTVKPAAPPPKPAAPEPPPVNLHPDSSEVERFRADNLLHNDFRAWGKRLSAIESAALDLYIGSDYRLMNSHLRGHLDADSYMPAIRALDTALARAKTSRAITVHRGVKAGTPWDNIKVGETIREPGFLSTSINPQTAQNFQGGAIIEVRLPKGYSGGAYVNRIPDVKHPEYEFLIRPGSPFRVVERTGSRIVVEPARGARRRSPKLD